MTPLLFIVLSFIIFGIGGALGYYMRQVIATAKRASVEIETKQMLLDAKEKAKKMEEEAEKKIEEKTAKIIKDLEERNFFTKKAEHRILDREAFLEEKEKELQKENESYKEKEKNLEEKEKHYKEKEDSLTKELSLISEMSPEDAKKELLERVRKESEDDILVQMMKCDRFGHEKIEQKAKDILISAIHRFGNAVTTDVLTTSILIQNEELKGKIIGKEGRNIRAFEHITGVDVIIDETPGIITLSCFDAVRRQIARVALENLILDGRIQPVKIEECVEKAKQEINRIIKEKGEEAAYEAGVLNLDPRLLMILGRLHFRTSYGQNVLQHSVEMAHIAGMIAEEIGANVLFAKAGALLHDIGKAVDHEVQGTHVEIGRRILQKFGVDEEIIKAVQAHHEEYPYENTESIIVQVADAISGGRPGARRDSVENYLKRLKELEDIAHSFEGVEKVYAISAGREVRIFVHPQKITDLEARELARSIAVRIEQELKYPGEIKVSVIRESRAIEFAR
jgi:ribonucrease Y